MRFVSQRSLLLVLIVCSITCFVLAPLTGCDSDFMGGYNSLVNIMEPKANAKEVNEIVGVDLKIPAGTLFPAYHVITMGDGVLIGQVSFRYGGKEYVYRAGKTTKDITGIWLEGKELGAYFGPEESVDCQLLSNGTVWSRWFSDEIQYVLMSYDGEEERFRSVLKIVR